MARKIVPLTLDRFAALAAPCRACLFWELEPARRRHIAAEETVREKEAWLSQVLREWGSCGRVAVVDEQPVGYAVYVPARYAPGVHRFPTAPISDDAVLLTTVWIDPRYAGGGLGRMLVQGMAADLVRRGGRGAGRMTGRGGVRAIEAFGDAGPASGLHGDRCAAPADFLARVGFKTYRPHPTAPLLRMELKSTISWRDEVEGAWERLLGAVRPKHQTMPAPIPVPRHGQRPAPVPRETPDGQRPRPI